MKQSIYNLRAVQCGGMNEVKEQPFKGLGDECFRQNAKIPRPKQLDIFKNIIQPR